MPSWLIWVIIAVVVVAIIAAVAAAANKKKQERNRAHAGELREQAAQKATTVQQREAHAKETEAQAAAARAEADRKQAEAERLEAEATERQRAAADHRQEHQEHLRRADELDPDVNTKSEEYGGPGATGAHETVGDESTRHASHDAQVHESNDGQRVQDRLGGSDEHHDSTTVTHPDGSTETVAEPESGTHRA